MPAQTRVTDKNSGHDACPPVPLVDGSPDVFVNMLKAGRVGDPYAVHQCSMHSPHVGRIAQGSPDVFINHIPTGRIRDPVRCVPPCFVAEGSPDVFIDEAPTQIRKAKFESLKSSLEQQFPDMTAKEKFLLSFPETGEQYASEASTERDQQGWEYFADMLRCYYLSEYMSNGAYEVSQDWLDGYQWVKHYKSMLLQRGLNRAGTKQLLNVLKSVNKLPQNEGETVDFDFINYDPSLLINGKKVNNPYEFWSQLYSNFQVVPRDYVSAIASLGEANGLLAAMGSFTLKSIPKGTVKYLGNDEYEIKVTDMAIFAQDSFDFDGGQSYSYWDPETSQLRPIWGFFSGLPKVSDGDFQDLKLKYNIGTPFKVMSVPQTQEAFNETTVISTYP